MSKVHFPVPEVYAAGRLSSALFRRTRAGRNRSERYDTNHGAERRFSGLIRKLPQSPGPGGEDQLSKETLGGVRESKSKIKTQK
jgi:hypothetical protein